MMMMIIKPLIIRLFLTKSFLMGPFFVLSFCLPSISYRFLVISIFPSDSYYQVPIYLFTALQYSVYLAVVEIPVVAERTELSSGCYNDCCRLLRDIRKGKMICMCF